MDLEGCDVGGYVAEARGVVERTVDLPPGYTLQWSGRYESMQRAKAKLAVVAPAALAIILILLYMNFRSLRETLLVMLCW